MRARLCYFAFFILFAGAFPHARALQAGSPETALEEMARAEDSATFIKHLPVKVQQFLEKMPLPQRDAITEKYMVIRDVVRQGGTVTKSSDGHSLEITEKEGKPKLTITWKKTFIADEDALIQLELQKENHSDQIMVSMHYEDNEWRLTKVGEWSGAAVEPEFLTKEGPAHQENGQ